MDCCSLCMSGTSRGPFENLRVRASLHLQLRFIHPPPPMLVPLYRYNSKRVGTRWKGCTLHSLKISCRRIFRSLCLIFCVFFLVPFLSSFFFLFFHPVCTVVCFIFPIAFPFFVPLSPRKKRKSNGSFNLVLAFREKGWTLWFLEKLNAAYGIVPLFRVVIS